MNFSTMDNDPRIMTKSRAGRVKFPPICWTTVEPYGFMSIVHKITIIVVKVLRPISLWRALCFLSIIPAIAPGPVQSLHNACLEVEILNIHTRAFAKEKKPGASRYLP